jgi:transcriptional regulator with XRE-family HTH domain
MMTKLTVEEAAQRAGIHWRHWQKIERGECNATLDTLTKIANVFEIGLDELLGSELPTVPETSAGEQSRQQTKKSRPHVRRQPVRR